MGLSTKQVSGDQDWSQTLLQQSGNLEPPKPPPSRRQTPNGKPPELLKCPRCGSTNTKFCYFNNYNKSQPRHFCKACKRHWTKGGTLRNVPVGGGRKNKRPRISNPAAASTATAISNTQMNDDPIGSDALFQTSIDPEMNSFSNLRSIDAFPSSISASFQPSNSNIPMAATSSSNIYDQMWQIQVPDISRSYWNWSDLDAFVSADLEIPWEETEIIKH